MTYILLAAQRSCQIPYPVCTRHGARGRGRQGRGKASTPLQAPGKIGEKGSSRVSLLLLRRRHRPKRKRGREIHFPPSIPFSPPTSFLGGECKEEEVERNGVKAEGRKTEKGVSGCFVDSYQEVVGRRTVFVFLLRLFDRCWNILFYCYDFFSAN